MLIYDGDCGFCTTCVGWIEPRLRIPVAIVAWQEIDELGDLDLTTADVTTAAYFVDGFARTYRGHRGIARVLLQAKGGWPVVGAAMTIPPLNLLAAAAYRLVARYRHRLPGATAECALPRPVAFHAASAPG